MSEIGANETGDVAESYRYCRKLNRRFGSTYYWSTALLPPAKRPMVHALYGFCRYADEFVDGASNDSAEERGRKLAEFGDRFFADLERGRSVHPVLAAVVDTVNRLELDPALFRRFMKSMTMDVTITKYETFDDLMEYMDGSAAVIGEMMLPVLEPPDPEAVRHAARQLGTAFQLTNFLRDVQEDLARGRVYVPQETLRRFGADPHRGAVDPSWCAAMAFEIDRTRAIYRDADGGIAALPPYSLRCVRAARHLYSGILDRIEAANYDVFSQRVRVPHWRKLAAAARLVA